MTTSQFQSIAIIGRLRGEHIIETLLALKSYLRAQHKQVFFEKETAQLMSESKSAISANELNQHCDLIIAVGGDGSLLRAARIASDQNLPVLGINRGRLGFLTDIRPEELSKVGTVLAGEFTEEKRFLLVAELEPHQRTISHQEALNDVVLLPGAAAHMIEFSLFIDHQYVYTQRADGLIVATPTGSTAYALSGGGPILHPALNAVVLVPMFPHTLSSRPIVISGDSLIEILIDEDNEVSPFISCDGQERIPIPPGGKIRISRKEKQFRLIHPKDYNYFETLRVKLGWLTSP